jgi:Fe-S-cluster-containing dehydrogenase component/DMSO reductase anchor subunit
MMAHSDVPVLEREEAFNLVAFFLAEQRSLAPVIKFSRAHDTLNLVAPNSRYRDLLPLSSPLPGQQYAFEVDLDQCSGCKACVTACHSLNGLDEDETWRSVGVLYENSNGPAFQQAVTAACHHCVDPACLSGCPVNAYDKDPRTGIVHHLDDQCIGCQYCLLMCPYDVPKYSRSKRIVRKCDMCSSRLSTGEAPACVQGCPNEAIRITLIDQQQITADYRHSSVIADFLPTAPNPAWTVPTTRYISARPLGQGLTQGDGEGLAPSPSHLPLVLMLILTQASVGGFAWLAALSGSPHIDAYSGRLLAVVSLACGLAGLLASVFHLGRPHLAWRAVLNFRTSWMSREVTFFGLFAIAALLVVASPAANSTARITTSWSALTAGGAAIFASVMIYHDTRRAFWRFAASTVRFICTTLILGTGLLLITLDKSPGQSAALVLFLVTFGKLLWEISLLRSFHSNAAIARSALLLRGPLKRFVVARFIFGSLGGIICPLLLLNHPQPGIAAILAGAACFFSCLGELFERFLFFTAVSPERMPQGLT